MKPCGANHTTHQQEGRNHSKSVTEIILYLSTFINMIKHLFDHDKFNPVNFALDRSNAICFGLIRL